MEPKNSGVNNTMKKTIEEKWNDILYLVEKEHDVSQVAINAWIRPLKYLKLLTIKSHLLWIVN